MAHFYGEVHGMRGHASRLGSKSSGMHGHIRGWRIGCRVRCYYDETTDSDVVQVYRTSGSDGGPEVLVATFYENGEVQFAEALKENFCITVHQTPKRKDREENLS